MSQPRTPFLHDLVTTFAAPTQVLSDRSGQIGAHGMAVGAQGVLHADVRVLSAIEVTVDGGAGEHIATRALPVGSDGSAGVRFSHLLRHVAPDLSRVAGPAGPAGPGTPGAAGPGRRGVDHQLAVAGTRDGARRGDAGVRPGPDRRDQGRGHGSGSRVPAPDQRRLGLGVGRGHRPADRARSRHRAQPDRCGPAAHLVVDPAGPGHGAGHLVDRHHRPGQRRGPGRQRTARPGGTGRPTYRTGTGPPAPALAGTVAGRPEQLADGHPGCPRRSVLRGRFPVVSHPVRPRFALDRAAAAPARPRGTR